MFLPHLLIHNSFTRLSPAHILPRADETELGDDPQDRSKTDDPLLFFLFSIGGGRGG